MDSLDLPFLDDFVMRHWSIGLVVRDEMIDFYQFYPCPLYHPALFRQPGCLPAWLELVAPCRP